MRKQTLMLGLVIGALATACGDTDAPTSQTATAAASVTPPTTSQAAPPAAPAPKPEEGPTRVVGRPVVLRVTDGPKPGGSNANPQLLYVLIFRLSRNPFDMRSDPQYTTAGRFSFAGVSFNEEVSVGPFAEPRSLCFSGLLDTSDTPKSLKRIADGTKVPVVLQPYDVLPRERRRLGARRTFHVPILPTDYQVNDVKAGQALLQIGCYTKQLVTVSG